MNELQLIQSKIYEIRGQQVMLDFDLAEMYGIENKYLKRSVKHNIRRFPSDFMFELTKEEFNTLRCKNCTSNKEVVQDICLLLLRNLALPCFPPF